MTVTDIKMAEIKQIEHEIADLHLEEYPITAVQLKAIIDRLYRAEHAADRMAPFMRYYTDKNRLKKANDAWLLPRLGAILTAMATSVVAAGLTGLPERVITEGSLPIIGFAVLSFLIPFILVYIGLFKWIDAVQQKRLISGAYDEKPLTRAEMQVASYARYYGAQD